jgi:tetratricopeptide (TPR) repeat protein
MLLACSGGDFEDRLGEARAQQERGRPGQPLELLERLAAEQPDHPEVNFRLGVAMLAAGRATEAVFPLHRATESDEYAVTAGLMLASTLSQTRNFTEALRAADRVLERDPEQELALMLRASAAVELHDGVIALEAVDRLLERSPGNRNYQLLHALALAEDRRLDDAEREFHELVDGDFEGEPQVRTQVCTARARFLFEKRKDSDSAVASVRDCIDRDPNDVGTLAALVGMLHEFERREDLVAILEQAVEKNPDARNLREALITQLAELDRADEARRLAEEWADEVDDAQSWLSVANLRRRGGDVAGAFEAIERVMATAGPRPGDEILFSRAELLLELGRVEEAEAQAESIQTELYKTVLEGRFAQQRGEHARALELYGKAAIEWPHNFGMRVLAARAAFALGDTDRARSDLLEATRQAPKETDAALWLAHIAFVEGRYNEAVNFARRHISERGTRDPSAHVLIAETLAAGNRTKEALAILESLAQERDGAFRGVAFAVAARLQARRDPTGALAEFERKLREAKLDLAEPAQLSALNQLVELQIKTGGAEDARRRLETLLKEHPDEASLIALRGRVALVEGRFDAAEQDFARALELSPEAAAAQAGLALLQRERGELAKATESMRRAAASAPAEADYAYMAARMTLDLGERAEARKLLEAVARDHPGSAAAANDLAFLLAEDGVDLDEAQQHAERAVRLQPAPETFDTLGYVLLRRGAADQALGLFEHALRRNPEYATARYHLALALIETGEQDAARKALEEALAKPFPEEQAARNVLARIDGAEAGN